MIIIAKCLTCQHINRQELGVPGFTRLQYEFDSFTDAFNHLLKNRNHEMKLEVQNENK